MRKRNFQEDRISKNTDLEILNKFSSEESLELAKNWINSFIPGVIFDKNRIGYLWESIQKDANILTQNDAINFYNVQKVLNLVIFPDPYQFNFIAFYCKVKTMPSFSGEDCFVFPKNLAWTMVFTHEDFGLCISPFFIKNKEYEVLNRKNVKSVH